MKETADEGGTTADEVQTMKVKSPSPLEVLEDPSAHEQAVEAAGTAAIQGIAGASLIITITDTSIGITGDIGHMN